MLMYTCAQSKYVPEMAILPAQPAEPESGQEVTDRLEGLYLAVVPQRPCIHLVCAESHSRKYEGTDIDYHVGNP